MKFHLSALFAASLVPSVVVVASPPTDLEVMYPFLGVNSLEVYDYKYDVTVDKNCDYTFQVQFEHVDAFDVGTAETCAPGVFSQYNPEIPIIGTFYFYEVFPEYVKEATGFDHLSIDYNPCGHPSDGWFSAHYDMHFYLISPEYRATQMDCDRFAPVPILCDFTTAQTSLSGQKYFTTPISSVDGMTPLNMPAGFELGVTDAVVNMGMHAFDKSDVPEDPAAWTEPSLIYGTHDEVVFFEPMVPEVFTFGTENKAFSRDIEYVEQTIDTLPYHLAVRYNAAAGKTTVTFSGKSEVCQKDFEKAKKAYEKESV